MRKSIKIALNNYPSIPPSLEAVLGSSKVIGELDVDLAQLFHHYYLDTRGHAPLDPDLAQFEHLSLLLPSTEFRVAGDGFGIGSAFRRHRSNELGQAFCRWFLYEHLDITYFAHMEDVLNCPADRAFGELSVHRVQSGDVPDYICARNVFSVFLAEAKGRVSSISFNNSAFDSWGSQFDRVVVKDKEGVSRAVKGHIVATRFATEKNHASVKSTVFAEDPASPGEIPLEEAAELASRVIALHCADIAAKIRQPILSAALRSGVQVPADIQFPGIVWELLAGPFTGMRFVGGYFPSIHGASAIRRDDGRSIFLSQDPLRLDVARGSFFGVEEDVFRGMCTMARSGDLQAAGINELRDIPFVYSGLSLLRDGSIIGPVEFFNPLNLYNY